MGGIESSIQQSEYGYGWYDDLRDHVKIGANIKVKLMSIDPKSKKINVSRKAVLENRWEQVPERFRVGAEYVGTVSGIANYGPFINMMPGIDALSNHIAMYRNNGSAIKKGDRVLVRVQRYSVDEEKMNVRIVRKI